MEQNYIINFASELFNNLYSDISATTQGDICYNTITTQLIDVSSTLLNMFTPNMFRPIIISYLNEDTSHNSTIYDSSHITLASGLASGLARNTYYTNYSRATNLRDILRSIYINYTEEDENNTFLETFINSTFDNKAKFKKVISTSELEKLKPQKFNKINETTTNIQCPILYYNFEENEEIIKLPCNHNYNCEAIIKWLSQESNTCPVCRYEFDYKEINIDNKRQSLEQTQDQDQYQYQYQDEDQDEDQEVEQNSIDTPNIYNLFSSEDILMQQILLDSYSNNNH
jgi:hypothetical protein